MFSLESPHRGDSSKYRHYAIFRIKKRKSPQIILNLQLNLQLWDFSGDSKRDRNSCGKRVISVQVIEGLLYMRIIVSPITGNCDWQNKKNQEYLR